MKISIAMATFTLALAPLAHADPESVTATASEASEPRLSVNPNLFGILVGNYGANVEYLFPGGHGVIVEGAYWAQNGSQTTLNGAAGTIGYRWHWSGKQNSGFLGINASASFASGNASVIDSSGNAMTYGASLRQLELTGNIGKRWMIGPANITFRVGAGYASRTVTMSSSTDPQGAAQAGKSLTDLISLLPIALDGELSVGYTF